MTIRSKTYSHVHLICQLAFSLFQIAKISKSQSAEKFSVHPWDSENYGKKNHMPNDMGLKPDKIVSKSHNFPSHVTHGLTSAVCG